FAFYADPPADPDELRYTLLRHGATHVLAQPVELLSFKRYQGSSVDANSRWWHVEAAIAGWPSAFKQVHQESADGTFLYAVVPDSTYPAAYERYRQAFPKLDQADWKGALVDLNAALKLAPQFPGALNAAGTALILSGGDLGRAEQHLKAAVAL